MTDFTTTMDVAAKGMQAQSQRLRVIAENLANSDTTPTAPGEDPYRRQVVTFKSMLDRTTGARSVAVSGITQDSSDFNTKYEPGHPAADASGYIKTPNVNPMIENMDMREAQRTYEANLNMLELTKSMMLQTVNALR